MEGKSKKHESSISITKIAALLGVLIPIFYAFGYLYDLGYLSEYGLSSEYFTRSHQDYLFKFYYVLLASTTSFFSLVVKYFVLIVSFVVVGVLFLFFFHKGMKKDREIPAFILKWIKKIDLKDSTIDTLESILTILITFLLGMLTLFLFTALLTFLALPMMKGQKDARTEMLNYTECIEGSPHKQTCTFIYSKDKKQILSGLLIAKSDKQIAIWNGKKAIVYPIKDEIIVVEKAKQQKIKKTSDK